MDNNPPCTPSPKPRIGYIDSTKGILILLLIFHHIPYVGFQVFRYSNSLVNQVSEMQMWLCGSYFMQTFFLITGFCSNYNKGFVQFLKTQLKTLLLPMLLFSVLRVHPTSLHEAKGFALFILKNGSSYWFLSSLFCAKILYFFLNKTIRPTAWLIAVCSLLSLLGSYLHQIQATYNYWFYYQTMDMILYLCLGNRLKSWIQDDRLKKVSIGIYICLCIVLVLSDVTIPGVAAGSSTTVNNWALHVVLALTGSLLILNVGKWLEYDFFKYMGSNSIVVYIFHLYFLEFLLKALCPVFMANNYAQSFMAIFVVYAITVWLSYYFCKLINTKPLRWSIGKF